MRIPLYRSGHDETPIAWWEWLFAPVMMPLFMLLLLVAAIVSVPWEFVHRLRVRREERQLRARLAAVGRSLEWLEVEAKLRAGEGTLIVEHRGPKGPVREWWTENDLIAAAPVPLPSSIKVAPAEGDRQPFQEYARSCAARYVDVASGTAKLTAVPAPLPSRLDPRKYVVVDLGGGLMTAIILPLGRRLAERYPRARVVTLITWADFPLLLARDAESVFLGAAEPGAAANQRRD